MKQCCKVYKHKNQETPDYLPDFVQMLGTNLSNGADEMNREVIYCSLGHLATMSRNYKVIFAGIVQLLQNFAAQDIMNANTPSLLKYRAIWAMSFITDQDGLNFDMVNAIFNAVSSDGDLSVRVEAALCISEIVADQPQFATAIKPSLS